jgi:HPt (histidine-containing phosphotransfer) domain-containing protein
MSDFACALAGREWSIPVLDKEETPSRLDAATIESLRLLGIDDPGFPGDLIASYRSDTEAGLDDCDRAVVEHDRFAICALAHVLCGSSANLGAVDLIKACRAIEHLGLERQWNQEVSWP